METNNLNRYLYLTKQQKARLPLFLQLLFLMVGAMLIVAFAFLVDREPQEVDASLFSPLVQTQPTETKKVYSYKLLYGETNKVIFKETVDDAEALKLVNLGTNLTSTIASGVRVGYIGFLDPATLLFLEDKEGLGKFIINKYNLEDKSTLEILAFNGPSTLASNQLDQLVAISPNKTRLVITHQSGIVIYTIKTEEETTILESTPFESCQKDQTCLTYSHPQWISDSQLLIFQEAQDSQTPLIVDSKGTITAVLPNNLHDLSISAKGFPLAAVSEDTLFYLEPKKTTEVLQEKETRFQNPVWLGKEIVAFAYQSKVPTVIKTDKLGKKVITLKAFATDNNLADLITNQNGDTIFFLETTDSETNINVAFYKMGLKEEKPESFYSISKNQ